MTDIAVVGLDCRFPKASDPARLWKLLLDNADGIDEISPTERWNAAALLADQTINHRTGGSISDADAFDNEFFGIPPREAGAMDPQQRLLLQTAWRALENATLDPRAQAGSKTGVFVGVMANEWAHLHLADHSQITAQSGTGNGYFMTANRLSYQLDLRGPSLAVDTACSSSLVAVHLAVQALRNGECEQAIAAGVNLALTPALNVFYTQAGLAAPDGRCKPFSSSADGIGRGEGIAAVVLRRLDDAVAARLPIYAVIKGSAVNSDGRTNGITAPSRWAQQQVIDAAYQAAGITPAQLSFIEAHGTGTLLGDMIEAKALAHAHRSRRDQPCAVGSIKGNLGHTEGAAGIAGLIKVVLSLHHGVVPPSRFADTENEALRLADSGLRLLSEPMELPADTVYAGVSSFGIGGTNCHVVLATAPTDEPVAQPKSGATGGGILTLSADCTDALHRNAFQLAIDIESSAAPLSQLCWSTNQIKSRGKVRLAIVTGDRAEAVAALRAEGLETGVAGGMSVGWLFSGQGTQYPGMAAALQENIPAFRDAFDQVEAALLPHLGVRIRDVMDDDRINRTEFAQPGIFALQYAQAQALVGLGAEPAWLLGRSIGEYAAAVLAEVFSLDDACRLVAARGRLMQQLPGGGGMLAVRGSLSEIDGLPLDLAAVNGPEEVVLSGALEEIERAERTLTEAGVWVRRLNVSHAFHSRLMEPITEEFAVIAGRCDYELPAYPIYSTLHGRILRDDETMDAAYWTAHIVATVRFADAATAAMEADPTLLVEFGPKRNLDSLVLRAQEATSDAVPPTVTVASGIAETVASLYRHGLNPKWNLLYPAEARVAHRLSGYQFSTANRFWIKESANTSTSASAGTPTKDTTMDNLIALFREQAAVLAAYSGGNIPTVPTAPFPGALTTKPTNSSADIVRSEIARVSGFPQQRLRDAHTIIGDLGFDPIMVKDLFGGLNRKLPGRNINLATFGPATTVADVIMLAGGRTDESATGTTPNGPVTPEYQISEFAEVKALAERIAQIEAAGVENPYFVVNDGITNATSIVNGVEVINFSSFNYLGMSGHPAVAEAMADAVRRWGSSCSASRLLAGEKPIHRDLELELAKLLGTQDALALVNGYATNVTVIGHLLGESDLVIHDSLAHDSIVQGCKLSGATRRPFPHNDPAALDEVLTNIRQQYRRVLIIIEGVYSQDGDIADLPAFIDVKRKHQALLMIDEAHSIGVLGATGGGIGEYFDVDRGDVELWSGTLSKALAACGGYVAGTKELIQFLKHTTPGFIFSGGIPPTIAAAALAAIRTMHSEPEHLVRLRELSMLFLRLAREAGLDTGDSLGTPIVPCIVGDSITALKLSNALLKRGVNVNPMTYPAVPEGKARLRFFITSCHSEDQIRYAIKVLTEELALAKAEA
ncbi:polyketide synthase [Mycobacterium intermedium]|uniref:Polyketide synthase n=1 Tax=Mycobacterium intermedium TaxID=28445 RepID=A0A1E3S8J8_MYCIE|nr:type I polyketide synthase [Mycobacterium intermedium]MCV6964988.1 aminotransferase class I/II-fold pyridoxal phosphate-dependent enzyme [Mycobacterium intermedium]ODQ98469.1 polyketide synthase [Mycobacterium intermedium]OPE48856.1 polyketide synthase [Mycobacterium intermedium]ORA96488.1 polyketide synthase [Mycobacterium intermedium]